MSCDLNLWRFPVRIFSSMEKILSCIPASTYTKISKIRGGNSEVENKKVFIRCGFRQIRFSQGGINDTDLTGWNQECENYIFAGAGASAVPALFFARSIKYLGGATA